MRKKIDVNNLLSGMLAPRSILVYEHAWKLYLKYCGTFTEAMKGETLTNWRQHLVTETTYSANTINHYVSGIKTIAEHLYAKREIEREALWELREVKSLPKNALKERRRPNNRTHIEPEQMRAICKAPALGEYNLGALRDRAMMLTLATSGCRLGECLEMKFEDIKKMPSGRFIVTNVISKHQGEPRTVPISGEAYKAILEWIEFRPISSPYIFTSVAWCEELDGMLYSEQPMCRQTALYFVKKYAASVGMPDVTPHDFRRFVATQLIKKNGIRTAQKVLGHANIASTALYDTESFEEGISENLF